REGAHADGDAADDGPTADRDDDRVDLVDLLRDLERDRPEAGELVAVVGVVPQATGLGDQAVREFVAVRPVDSRLAACRSLAGGGLDLAGIRRLGHHAGPW